MDYNRNFHIGGVVTHMADQPDAAPALSNSKARHETIRTAMRKVAELEAERREIGAEIKTVKQTLIKGQLGFELEDWKMLQRLYDVDQERRDKTIDTLREGFAALGIGEQLDFVKTLDIKDEEPRAPEASPAGVAAAPTSSAEIATYNQGRIAGLNGASGRDNPWPEGVKAHDTWERGWVAGQTELSQDLKPPAAGGGATPSVQNGSGHGSLPAKRGRGRPRKDGTRTRPKAGADLVN